MQKVSGRRDFRMIHRKQQATQVCRPYVHYFFRREGGDDFFEARLAAQRIPQRHQFQFAIAEIQTATG